MDFLDRAASSFINARRTSTSKLSGGILPFFGWGGGSKPVIPVTHKNALTLSGVWNAVDIISNSIAMVPFMVYEKLPEGGRRRIDTHPADWILTNCPDGDYGVLTPFRFKKIAGISLALRGNVLFEKKLRGNGEQFLQYICWDDVQDIAEFEDNTTGDTFLAYYIKGGKALLDTEVLHIRGFSFDGVCGVSIIKYAALNLGVGIELQNFSYSNAQNRGSRQGVIETDKVIGGTNAPSKPPARPGIPGLTPAAEPQEKQESVVNTETGKRAIIAGWRAAMQERDPDRVVVLDEGMKYKPLAITPQEAQLIEERRFNIEDVARWWNLPPHMLKDLSRSTNNNIEQQSIEFLTHTMQPLISNIEQEFAKSLLTVVERKKGVYIKGNVNVLLRMDSKSRAEYYSKMKAWGIYTSNEIRELEDMNPKEGGDELQFPVNLQTMEQINKSLENGN